MSRTKGRGGFRNRAKGPSRKNDWSGAPRRDATELIKKNEQFEKYYNELNIIPEGPEREEFWAALRRDLPNSFRFCGSKSHALSVQKNLLERYIPQIESLTFNDEAVTPPTPIPWYPANLAWQMTTPKAVVRKFAPFSAFQKFLVSENSVGNISRQEIVSMIPPLLMDIKPEHTILDLCAAPGSKSAQIVELLHKGEESKIKQVQLGESKHEDEGRSTGLLIANDVNYQRAQMLVHQVKRLNSPNLIVMNHDATLFPSIQVYGQATKWLKFDRILADVPCSGDGTCRKNPGIWKDWAPSNALGLYVTQVRILVRSLQMLKVGGKVIYSTCSMNPLENEAIISTALDRCGGLDKIDIIDCSQELAGLKRSSGLKSWKVMDKAGRIWNSYKDVEDAPKDQNLDRIVPGMFPSEQEYPLERCIRIYPHLQDTGAFFITVLEKKGEIKAKPEVSNKKSTVMDMVKEIETIPLENGAIVGLKTAEDFSEHLDMTSGTTSAAVRQNKEALEGPPQPILKRSLEEGSSDSARIKRARIEIEPDSNVIGEVGQMEHYPPPPVNLENYPDMNDNKRRRNNNAPQEESFKFLTPDHPDIEAIFKFYELPTTFPRDRFMVRNATGEPAKAIYYTTELARNILTTNEGKGMKFVHSGVKMFVKQDVHGADTCRWRIQNEGLPIIEGWISEKNVFKINQTEVLRFLLREMFPKIQSPELAEVRGRIDELHMGCSILRMELDGETLVLPFWKSVVSINLMLPKEDRKAMLLRLFNDDSALIDHNLQKAHQKNEESIDQDEQDVEDNNEEEDSNQNGKGHVSEDGESNEQTDAQ